MRHNRFAAKIFSLVFFLSPSVATVSAAENGEAVREDMLVSTNWLTARLDDPQVVIVHVARTRTGYDRGHIPGARFLPWSEIARDIEGVLNEMPPPDDLAATIQRLGIDDDKRVVLYDGGEGIPAARAYVVFDYLGLGDRTALLDGHWPKWTSEKRPVSTEEPQVTPSQWQPQRLRPEIIVDLREMRRLAGSNQPDRRVPLIDARSGSDYAGAVRSDHVPRPGHIPGAENIPSSGNFASKDLPALLPAARLREMYADAGAQPGEQVVVYCRTGASASVAYFVARYLGYQPRLYDGSFSQWSAQADTPVVCNVGKVRVRVSEPGGPGHLHCRAWVQAGGERYYRPEETSCIPYDKDQSFSCPGVFTITVPPGPVVIHVERGKEYHPVEREVRVQPDRTTEVSVELKRWVNMPELGWYSADWHVHFGADDPEVLKQQALADDVHLLPVLGLWNQNQADWPFPTELGVLKAADGYMVTRHNQEIERIGGGPFESMGAPLMYGLSRPVYYEGLEHTWPPDVVLVRQAKQDSPGCVVDTDKPTWAENVITMAFGLFDSAQLCHNHYNRGRTIPAGWGMAGAGIEERQGTWGDDELFVRTNTVYYRWLNCGFRLAATGGSAMGVMPAPLGYNRTYAKLEGPLSEQAYLRAVLSGRTFATSGPMLFLTANGQDVGATIACKAAADDPVRIRAELQSAQPIDSLELIHNGLVVRRVKLTGRSVSPILKEVLEAEIHPERSGWVAARAMFEDGPGHSRQAHTSPIYISVEGQPVAFKQDAYYMIRWIDELLDLADRPERYASDSKRTEAKSLFLEARAVYQGIVRTAERVWGD